MGERIEEHRRKIQEVKMELSNLKVGTPHYRDKSRQLKRLIKEEKMARAYLRGYYGTDTKEKPARAS